EEFQAIHVSSDECFERIETRWLREVDAFEEAGGISRWSPARSKPWMPGWMMPFGMMVREAVETSRAGIATARRRGAAAVRHRGAGAGAPAAGQGGGAAARGAEHWGTARPRASEHAVTPSVIVLNGRATARIADGSG